MDTNTIHARLQPSIRCFFLPDQSSPKNGRALPPTSPSDGVCQSSMSICNKNPESTSKEYTLPGLPAQASIVKITQSQIQPLRRINAILLPISYPDSFYHKIISPESQLSFSRAIIWSDPEPKVVGGIVCRVEAVTHESSKPGGLQKDGCQDVYIQSLALLSPYRRKGLAAEALLILIQQAIKHQELKIRSFYAHVWTNNKEVLNWYLSQGFQREDHTISGYYHRLKPDSAWILRRWIIPTNSLSRMSLSTTENDCKCVYKTRFPQVKVNQPLETSESARSFQGKGPEQEWNDLPEDVICHSSSGVSHKPAISEINVRAEIAGKTKKKRVYPITNFAV